MSIQTPNKTYPVAVLCNLKTNEDWKTSRQTYFFRKIVLESQDLGVSCVFFHPKDWRQEKQEIYGRYYNLRTTKWERKTIPRPSFIYTRYRIFNAETRQYWLQFKEACKQTDIKLYNPIALVKLVWDKVKFHQFLEEYQFPTLEAHVLENYTPKSLAELMKIHPIFYLKPRKGSQGDGIFQVEQLVETQWKLTNKNQETIYPNLDALFSKFYLKQDSNQYFAQKSLSMRTYQGRNFDIRVLVQNNGFDEYQMTGIGLRLAPSKTNLSNLSQGGTPTSLEAVFGENALAIRQKVEALCLAIAARLHQKIGTFLEIGFDILMDNSLEPYMLEGNTKPSRWLFFKIAEQYAKSHPLHHQYLNMRKQSARQILRFFERKLLNSK
ncbi:MAG: YheC/YheD family protein [Saprospiraceae bacterium]|nr:YheC/YheD family protein [Saprospiraceae bacterium]